jgi:hypothetical protein
VAQVSLSFSFPSFLVSSILNITFSSSICTKSKYKHELFLLTSNTQANRQTHGHGSRAGGPF